MKTVPTRTLNPLPFNDLEPHRFEDLIRQLAYEFRRWKSLEATGRAGSDDGIDIRATELVPIGEDLTGEEEADETSEPAFQERVWIFQCKREKSLPPKRLRKVVEDSLVSLSAPPHGFILAVACDVSKNARDAFREEMVARGIEEFFIWAKSELEDLLFQPNNDRLLFAYFGISLQPRRRSLTTTLRSDIAKKKQLNSLIGEEDHHVGKLVLLRDPTDNRFPEEPKSSEPPGRWLLCRAMHLRRPGHLVVLVHEHMAAVTAERDKWDAIFNFDVMKDRAENELSSEHAWGIPDRHDRDRSAYDFWNEYIDEAQRAYLKIVRWVPLERILALDPLGDGYFPVPHILVDFADTTGPFTAHKGRWLVSARSRDGGFDIDLSEGNRARIFPNPLPKAGEPEPKEFDDTGSNLAKLSSGAGDRLNAVLAGSKERKSRFDFTEEPEVAAKREAEVRARVLEFRKWRDKIALPVLSSFVHKLRAAGHRARVRIQSSESPPSQEFIELRVRLQIYEHYAPSAELRISMFEHAHGEWQIKVSPEVDRGRSQSSLSSHTLAKPDAQTTREQLEGWVVEMLERLQAQAQ